MCPMLIFPLACFSVFLLVSLTSKVKQVALPLMDPISCFSPTVSAFRVLTKESWLVGFSPVSSRSRVLFALTNRPLPHLHEPPSDGARLRRGLHSHMDTSHRSSTVVKETSFPMSCLRLCE